MTTSSGARDRILQRIRTANGREGDLPAAQREWDTIPRSYKSAGSLHANGRLELFMDRLRDYEAEVVLVPFENVAAAIDNAVRSRLNPRMLIAPGFSMALLANPDEFTPDDNFTPAELDCFDGILTEAAIGIAETGTLVLQSVPGQGRRAATLVPDFHICVLTVSNIVETVPEALRILAATATLSTTFVSGPSATADIEMTRIKGVHGPRFLHVILVDNLNPRGEQVSPGG